MGGGGVTLSWRRSKTKHRVYHITCWEVGWVSADGKACCPTIKLSKLEPIERGGGEMVIS